MPFAASFKRLINNGSLVVIHNLSVTLRHIFVASGEQIQSTSDSISTVDKLHKLSKLTL